MIVRSFSPAVPSIQGLCSISPRTRDYAGRRHQHPDLNQAHESAASGRRFGQSAITFGGPNWATSLFFR
jgi:hypothetical protein